jgi:hypothetical protein
MKKQPRDLNLWNHIEDKIRYSKRTPSRRRQNPNAHDHKAPFEEVHHTSSPPGGASLKIEEDPQDLMCAILKKFNIDVLTLSILCFQEMDVESLLLMQPRHMNELGLNMDQKTKLGIAIQNLPKMCMI